MIIYRMSEFDKKNPTTSFGVP